MNDGTTKMLTGVNTPPVVLLCRELQRNVFYDLIYVYACTYLLLHYVFMWQPLCPRQTSNHESLKTERTALNHTERE